MYTTLKFIGTPLVSVTETPLRVYWDTLRGSLTTIVDKTPQGVFNKEPFFNCVWPLTTPYKKLFWVV